MKKRYLLFSALLLAVVLSLDMNTIAFAEPDDQLQPNPTAPEQNDPAPSQPQPQKTALPLPAIIFFVGLVAAVAGLVVLHISKRRRETVYEEWDDDEDEP